MPTSRPSSPTAKQPSSPTTTTFTTRTTYTPPTTATTTSSNYNNTTMTNTNSASPPRPPAYLLQQHQNQPYLAQPPRPTRDRPQQSYLSKLVNWLRVQKYRYEVTIPLYMMTPTERIIFNTILLGLIVLLLTAIVYYLPNHLSVVSSRVWYYLVGEEGGIGGAGLKDGGSVGTTAVASVVREGVKTAAAADAGRGFSDGGGKGEL